MDERHDCRRWLEQLGRVLDGEAWATHYYIDMRLGELGPDDVEPALDDLAGGRFSAVGVLAALLADWQRAGLLRDAAEPWGEPWHIAFAAHVDEECVDGAVVFALLGIAGPDLGGRHPRADRLARAVWDLAHAGPFAAPGNAARRDPPVAARDRLPRFWALPAPVLADLEAAFRRDLGLQMLDPVGPIVGPADLVGIASAATMPPVA